MQRELVTPTGAAIVATLCDTFGPQPPMTVSAIGYGAGTADLEGQPNVLRIMIGEAAEKVVAGFDEEISVIEANLDDMNPQIYGYFLEKALAAGALDVYTTPVQMKKNRPGTLLTMLCKPQDTNALMSLIFAETTTFGVRTYSRAAPHSAARIGERTHHLRRRAHQAFPRQRPHPARRAGIRRLPQTGRRKKMFRCSRSSAKLCARLRRRRLVVWPNVVILSSLLATFRSRFARQERKVE